jgi:hypothetical protein
VRLNKRTESEVMAEFLRNLQNFADFIGIRDSKITLVEFEEFFAYISAAIEGNNFFELLCTSCWNLTLPGGDTVNIYGFACVSKYA